MKFAKLFTITFILLVNCQILISQEKDKNNVLLVSRPSLTYEELALFADQLAFEIKQNQKSIGYIVVYDGRDKIKNAFYKSAVIRNIKFRGYDENKLQVISSTDLKNPRTEFWISKDGTKPLVQQEKENFVLPKAEKAINFVEDLIEITEIDGKPTFFPAACDAGCITLLDFYLLSDFLDANSQLKAFVIIHAKNFKNAKRTQGVLNKVAVEDAQILSNRLNFLFGGKNKLNSNAFSEVEVYLASDDSQLPKSSVKYKSLNN